ncbi:hypothetical protein [Thermodesulfobacterium hydrogeniphilum]|uniref:hypothetical protein n=1 Tax=Thermodesulfobacterium hydrogeniphilum TaxID=161156 RepID=UPI00056EE13A|nr:hypothetical protein [Thermodesulfobacterium hydrogeniphilum]
MDKIVLDELVLTTNKKVAKILPKYFRIEAWHVPNKEVFLKALEALYPGNPNNIYLAREIYVDNPEWTNMGWYKDVHFGLRLIPKPWLLYYLCENINRLYFPYTRKRELKELLLGAFITGNYIPIYDAVNPLT